MSTWDPSHEGLVVEAVRDRRPNDKGWVRANCPLCELVDGKSDRKGSFGFNAYSLRYECYRCGSKGRLRNRPEEYERFDVEERPPAPKIEEPEGFYLLDEATWDHWALRAAWDYLLTAQPAGRGLTFDHVVNFSLGACLTGRSAGRVVIPIYDADGTWLWYVARSWHKKVDRPYLYPIGDRNGVMFNTTALDANTDEPALIVEGCFDAIPHAPHAVGALGKITDERVLAQIEHHVLRPVEGGHMEGRRPVCFVPDGDEWEAGYAAAMRLRLAGIRAGALRLPPKVDPDEITHEELMHQARASVAY